MTKDRITKIGNNGFYQKVGKELAALNQVKMTDSGGGNKRQSHFVIRILCNTFHLRGFIITGFEIGL